MDLVRTSQYNIVVGQAIEVFERLPSIGSSEYLNFVDALYQNCEVLSVYFYGVREADLNQQLTLRDLLQNRAASGTVTLQFIAGLTCSEAYVIADAQHRLTLLPSQTLHLDPSSCKYTKRASRLAENLILSQHEAVSYGFADDVQLGFDLEVKGLDLEQNFQGEEEEEEDE